MPAGRGSHLSLIDSALAQIKSWIEVIGYVVHNSVSGNGGFGRRVEPISSKKLKQTTFHTLHTHILKPKE
jgi:hypothetical protein